MNRNFRVAVSLAASLICYCFALATAEAQTSLLQLFLAQYDTPLNTLEVKVMQAGKVVGICNYGTAEKDFYPAVAIPNVTTKKARCNMTINSKKPALILPNTAVKKWVCTTSNCQDDITVSPSTQNRIATMVFQGGAPLPPSEAPKPPNLVTFQIFLAHKNSPLDNTKVWVMQDGKEIGNCTYGQKTHHYFPLLQPAGAFNEMAGCGFKINNNRPALILFSGGGGAPTWYCPPGQFKNCQTDITIAPGEAEGGAVMVFPGGDPLSSLKLYVRAGSSLGNDLNPAVKLFHGAKEKAHCNEMAGGFVGEFRLCEFKLPKGAYSVDAVNPAYSLETVCPPFLPGNCVNTRSFLLQGDSIVVVNVSRK